jgi:hypothetical protein
MAYMGENQYWCDAEIRCRDGLWRHCCVKAVWQRGAASGITMHYCEKHRNRAFEPRVEHYRPAPQSEATQIN